MDGYTYMIERNKLLIGLAREHQPAGPSEPLPADADALLRKRLKELYDQLEGCGRTPEKSSE